MWPGPMGTRTNEILNEELHTSATNAEGPVAHQRRLSVSVGDVKHAASASAYVTRSRCVSRISLQ